MKPSIQALRTLLLLLALTGASSLAGCKVTFKPVDLDRAENPRDISGRSGRREPGGPGDH